MTSFLLLKALCDFLREVVEDYAASQNENGEWVIPRVFEWSLPYKNPRANEKIDFPYIVARIINGEDPTVEVGDLNGSTVSIYLAFGVYRESEKEDGFIHPDGAFDLLNLMETVRIALFRKAVLNHKFEIIKPYKWDIPDEQPYPLWDRRFPFGLYKVPLDKWKEMIYLDTAENKKVKYQEQPNNSKSQTVRKKAAPARKEPMIYVGPNLREGRLSSFMVFKREYPPFLTTLMEQKPALKKLIVPLSKLKQAKENVKQPGTIEFQAAKEVMKRGV